MNQPSGVKKRLERMLVGLTAVVASVITGTLLGLLFVRLFVPKTGMGWDQLADALGGMMVGGLLGLLSGVVLVTIVDPGRRLMAVGALAVIGLLALAGLWLARPAPHKPEQPIRGKPYQTPSGSSAGNGAVLSPLPCRRV